jgi:hypothetical protein
MISRVGVLCIPSIFIAMIFDLGPWGIIAVAVIPLAIYAYVIYSPRKAVVKANIDIALELLAYGNLNGAKDQIEIALRKAGMAKNLNPYEFHILQSACEKIASALVNARQTEAGTSLLYQCRTLVARRLG